MFNIQLVGVKFVKPNQFGDFEWMCNQEIYSDSLFIFNDNEEHHNSNKRGAGNAIIRQYNKYSDLDVPRSVGIPTGTMSSGGYTTFNLETKNKIDGYFNELTELITQHKYTHLYYSAESNGMIGTSIFKVNPKVLEYITWKIHSLTSKPIKIVTCVRSFAHQINSDYFDEFDLNDDSDDSDEPDDSDNSDKPDDLVNCKRYDTNNLIK